MNVEIISTSDQHTKEFATELFSDINHDNHDATYTLTVSDNFVNEIYQAGITLAIFIGGIIAEKSVEKMIDYLVEKVKDKMKKKESYDTKIIINVYINNQTNNIQYNVLSDVEQLKSDIKNAIESTKL